MRYAIVSKGLSLSQIETEATKIGAKNIKMASLLSQVFCDLDEAQAQRLSQIQGLKLTSHLAGGSNLRDSLERIQERQIRFIRCVWFSENADKE